MLSLLLRAIPGRGWWTAGVPRRPPGPRLVKNSVWTQLPAQQHPQAPSSTCHSVAQTQRGRHEVRLAGGFPQRHVVDVRASTAEAASRPRNKETNWHPEVTRGRAEPSSGPRLITAAQAAATGASSHRGRCAHLDRSDSSPFYRSSEMRRRGTCDPLLLADGHQRWQERHGN